jgi:small-conductance mechanosensitive channel
MSPASDNILMIGRLAVSPWVYGPVAFVVWVGVLWLVKWLVLHRLARASGRVARVLDFSVSLGIIATGLLLLRWLLPLPMEWNRVATTATRIALVLVGISIVDLVAILALRRLRGRVQAVDLGQGIVKGLVHAVIFAAGLVLALNAVGVAITPLIASLGVASLAVALAVQKPLANFFAGLLILADRSLNVGDFIVLPTGEKGWIERIGLRHTSIRMLPDDVVIVPNELIVSSTVHNTSLPTRPISVRVQVGVHYDSDLGHVERVCIEVARHIQQTVEGATRDWEPLVRFHTFDSSSINCSVILRVDEYVGKYPVVHEFIKALHARFREEGIVIPFPLRTLDIPDKTADTLRDVFQGKRRPSA